MDNYQMETWLMEYLSEHTDPRRRQELKQRLLKSGFDEKSLLEWEEFSSDLGKIPVPAPGQALTEGFYNKLASFKRTHAHESKAWISRLSFLKRILSKKYFPRIAYGFCLVALGWFAGYWITPETQYARKIANITAQMEDMKKMFTLTLLDQPSPAERIRAVGLVETIDKTDQKIINALMNTLNSDPNINVRLVTVEALARFTHIPQVREGLIRSISLQDAPIVQMALADLMVALREQRSLREFKKILSRGDLKYSVKTHIETSLAKL